jgi:hypothetical protein
VRLIDNFTLYKALADTRAVYVFKVVLANVLAVERVAG